MKKSGSDLMKNLSDEHLDEISKYSIPFNENNLSRIKERFWNQTRIGSNVNIKSKSNKLKRGGIKYLIAAAMVFCFAVTGFAMGGLIDIDEAYRKIFNGSGDNISQYGMIMSTGNTSNGIEFNTVAAMNDNDTAYVIFTLTDRTSDRLSESVDFYDSYSLDEGSSFTCRQLGYDPQTKTATFYVMFHGGNKLNGKKINFKITSLFGKKNTTTDTDLHVNVYDYITANPIAETMTVHINGAGGGPALKGEVPDHDQAKVLKSDKTDIQLNGLDWARITNIGFVDGKLHIQLNAANPYNYIRKFYFTDEHGNPKIEYEYSVYFKKSKNDSFREFIFDIADVSQIKGLTIKADYVSYDGLIEGNWKSSFKLASKMETVKLEDKYRLPNHKEVTLENITISPLGVTFDVMSESKLDTEKLNLKPQIKLKNGAIIDLKTLNVKHDKNKYFLKYSYAGIIELDKVEAMLIDGHLFKIK